MKGEREGDGEGERENERNKKDTKEDRGQVRDRGKVKFYKVKSGLDIGILGGAIGTVT